MPLLALIVPESPLRTRQRFDVLGAVLFGFGIGGVLIYVSEGASWGWGSINTLGYLIGGVVLIAAFLLWESRISFPIMDLKLLRSPKVSMVMTASLVATAAATLPQYTLPQYTLPQYTLPYMFETPVPAALKAQILAGVSAKEHVPVSLIEKFVYFRGDINYAAGYSVFQLAWHVIIFTSVAGMIIGPLGGIMARRYGARLPLIMDAVPARVMGISAAMLAVFGSIGSSLATALATPILTSHPFQLVATPPGGKPVITNIPQIYTDPGYTQVYLIIGGIVGLATLLIALALRSGREPARGGLLPELTATEADAMTAGA